jgi:DNA end-binding protein Ku
MAPARPYWKGYLKLSLVSCPIALYTGTSSTERVSFRQINNRQPAAPAAGRRGHARAR